jgi:dienelactone hydrolase
MILLKKKRFSFLSFVSGIYAGCVNGSDTVLNYIRFTAALVLIISIAQANPPPATSLSTMPLTTGYGAKGTYETFVDSMPALKWKDHEVYFFHPCFEQKPLPVIFFCHGIGAEDPQVYMQLLKHIVSWGYSVLYSPYEKSSAFGSPGDGYSAMWSGFTAGMRKWSAYIDTTRIGFVGHSFGGGAVPALAWKALCEKHWGGRGAFMYIMAPWYSYDISQKQLEQFPKSVALIMETFEDDRINDPRMAIDIFKSIAIPDSLKNFITLKSDTCEGEVLIADHSVPEGVYPFGWNVNALDYSGVYRLVNSLAALTFENDPAAKNIALGNGSPSQRYMGAWQNGRPLRELGSSRSPQLTAPQSAYANFWTHAANPRARRQSYFQSEDTSSINSATTILNYRSMAAFKKNYSGQTPVGTQSDSQSQSEIARESGAAGEKDSTFGNSVDTEKQTSASGAGKDVFRPIQSGFGSMGPFKVHENFYPHPSGGDSYLYCFMPQGISGRVPVVLFAPELLATGKKYRELLRHIASRGYAVVSSTYRYGVFINDVERYTALMQGFDGVLELIRPLIDTSRIGFMGHSYGAGAMPAVAWHYCKELAWGNKGAFCFLMGPSYVHCMTQAQFEQFPVHVNLLVEVFQNDHWNDFRIAEDIFYAINIHPAQKDFIIVNQSKHDKWEISPDYQSPFCEDSSKVGPVQKYAIFRLVDALAACTFDRDETARMVALGNGCAEQVYMGQWPDGEKVAPLVSTDIPTAHNKLLPHSVTSMMFPKLLNWFWPFTFSCWFDDSRNERRVYLVP